jgi:hypothetical protein
MGLPSDIGTDRPPQQAVVPHRGRLDRVDAGKLQTIRGNGHFGLKHRGGRLGGLGGPFTQETFDGCLHVKE